MTAVDVRGARKVYDARKVALDGVDLSVEPGRFVSIIGPSGCGKSTLLRLVAGLEDPDAGTVSVLGRTPHQAATEKMLGFVPQHPALLPWLSVLKNVSLPARMNRRHNRELPDWEQLLTRAGLGDALHLKPGQLSGGMRQRAALVRAFGLRPDVLLLDEPFSALDEFTRESVQTQLLDLWSEMSSTVLFVTHSIGEAVRLSDTVVVMGPGRITDVIDIDLPRPREWRVDDDRSYHPYEIRLREALQDAFEAAR